MNAPLPIAVEHPFGPKSASTYLRWRERKLAGYPRRVEDLIVEVRDPRRLSASEADELRRVCRAANMAIYSSPLAGVADKDMARRLGARLGLARLDANPLAEEDGISALRAMPEGTAPGYIPYTNRRLLWHTDGYYNPPQQPVRAFILHCVQPAAEGGENRLLDHEIAYILLRDADPAHIEALEAPDAMTIPANAGEAAPARAARTGPVFSADAGALHMRYTARTRSIEWRRDERTRAAVDFLNRTLESDCPYIFALRLAGGQGIVCNNVLHSRGAFTDERRAAGDDAGRGLSRLLYRARYRDRVSAHLAR